VLGKGGDGDRGEVKGLREDCAVHVVAVEFAEIGGVDVGGVENGFVRVGGGGVGVVAVGEYAELRLEAEGRVSMDAWRRMVSILLEEPATRSPALRGPRAFTRV
jgi:hypothetical protein